MSCDEVETYDGRRWLVNREGVGNDGASGPVATEEVKECLHWFAQAQPTATPTINSFWLKHVVEQWAGTAISHGALIVAASQAGFPIGREADADHANVTIGVAVESMNEYDCGCGS